MEYVLGRGSYGVVMKAKWISRNRDVAAKIIQTNNTNLVIREVEKYMFIFGFCQS